jgi:hypothetical protein
MQHRGEICNKPEDKIYAIDPPNSILKPGGVCGKEKSAVEHECLGQNCHSYPTLIKGKEGRMSKLLNRGSIIR